MPYKFKVFILTLLSIPLLLTESIIAEVKTSEIEELRSQILEIQKQNQQQIEMLLKKIESLENKRASDENKMDKLIAKEEAEDQDGWWRKVRAGYKKGLFIESVDGNYKIKMNLRGQFQFAVNDTDGEATSTDMDIRRFRVKWKGNAFRPWFLYAIELSGDSGDLELRDMYFDAAYNTSIVPRAGQFKVPFNRERLTSSSNLQFVERSITSSEFSVGRDVGVAAYGILGDMVTYGVGVFNGDGRAGKSQNSNLLYAGRIQFSPCCGKLKYSGGSFPSGGSYKLVPNFTSSGELPIIAIGVGVYSFPGLDIARRTPDDKGISNRFNELGIEQADVTGITADIALKYSRFDVVASYDGRWMGPDEVESGDLDTIYDQGFRVQGGLFLLPDTLELTARYAYIDYDDGSGITGDVRDTSWQITPAINYYISHDHRWKVQVDYNFIRNSFTGRSDVDENIFRAQLQAYF